MNPYAAAIERTDTFGKLCRRKVKFANCALEELAQQEVHRKGWAVAGATWTFEWYTKHDKSDDDIIAEEGLIVTQTLEEEDPAQVAKEAT